MFLELLWVVFWSKSLLRLLVVIHAFVRSYCAIVLLIPPFSITLTQLCCELNVSLKSSQIFRLNRILTTILFNRFWMMPSVLLKNIIMGNKSIDLIAKDRTIRCSIDFMNERLESLSQQQLASRLTLNCLSSYVQPNKLGNIPITIIDVSIRWM